MLAPFTHCKLQSNAESHVHINLPYAESNCWSVKVSNVCFDWQQLSWVSVREIFHHHLLPDLFNYRAHRLNMGLSSCKSDSAPPSHGPCSNQVCINMLDCGHHVYCGQHSWGTFAYMRAPYVCIVSKLLDTTKPFDCWPSRACSWSPLLALNLSSVLPDGSKPSAHHLSGFYFAAVLSSLPATRRAHPQQVLREAKKTPPPYTWFAFFFALRSQNGRESERERIQVEMVGVHLEEFSQKEKDRWWWLFNFFYSLKKSSRS